MIECPSCSSTIDEKGYLRTYFSDASKVEYKLYHCSNCDLEFWTPLEFIRSIYEEEAISDYKGAHQAETIELTANHRYFVSYYLKNLKKSYPSGTLLDVGCGNGSFIKYIEKQGFDVYGIDIDSKSVEVAKNKFGLKNVYSMSLDEFSEKFGGNLKFDMITCFEVLEHQTDIKSFISKVSLLLKDDGIFAGTVPNRNRAFADLTRYHSKADKNLDFPPHHFFWFSDKSLSWFFENNGFVCSVKETKVPYDIFADRISNLIYVITKIKLFDSDILKKNSESNRFNSYIAKMIRFLLVYPIAFFVKHIYEAMGGFGLFFYCKKKM